MLSSVVRRQSGGLVASMTSYLRSSAVATSRSFAAAAGLVEQLDRAALAGRRAVTVPLARSVLEQGDE